MKTNAFRLFLLFTFLVQSIPHAQEKPLSWGQIARSEVLKKRYKTKPQKLSQKTAKHSEIRAKIVGGSTSQANAYPWMAALVNSNTASIANGQFCGGTLIHPHWIVTAAHCVVDSPPSSIDVVLGAHNLNQPTNIQRINVTEIIIHPSYLDSGPTLNYDIALLRLEAAAEERFTPLPLIDDEALQQTGILARTMGWGTTSATQLVSPSTLQEVDLPIVDLSTANNTVAYSQLLTNQMLAAGLANGGVDTCQGDSGGPLMVPSPHPPGWALAGVVSFGSGCALPNAYGLYSKVSVFRDFILEHTSPNYLQWEQSQNIMGEFRDPDDDGYTNFAEFAFQTNSVSPDQPLVTYSPQEVNGTMRQGLQFRRARSAEGVTYTIRQNTNLTTEGEQTFDLETLQPTETAVADQPFATDSIISLPIAASEPRGFFRITAEPARKSTTGPRVLTAPGGTTGNLVADDPLYPGSLNRRQKLYRLTGISAGESLTLVGRSNAFDIVLELLDANTLEILETADSDAALGNESTDESLNLTPAENTDYILRLTSQSDGEGGFFELGCRPSSFTLPVVTRTSSVNGNLASSDTPSPTRLPNIFREDRYLYNNDNREDAIVVQASSFAFDARITVTSAESGRVVTFSDDAAPNDLNPRAIFSPIPGAAYIIKISSFSPNQSGSYQLSMETLTQTFPSIARSQTRSGNLAASDETDPNFPDTFKDDFILSGVPIGQTVTIRQSSSSLDTYLAIIDAQRGTILAVNDDAGDDETDSEITFTLEAGIDYIIRASSFAPNTTGSYSLSVE